MGIPNYTGDEAFERALARFYTAQETRAAIEDEAFKDAADELAVNDRHSDANHELLRQMCDDPSDGGALVSLAARMSTLPRIHNREDADMARLGWEFFKWWEKHAEPYCRMKAGEAE